MVYDANATDADATSPNNTIVYSLTGADASSFDINATTGLVTFKVSPDFDSPADADQNNAYQVVVHANDGVHNSQKIVTISVTDVNDNAPVFTSDATASAAENTGTATVVYDANATDADGTSANNTVTYALSGADASLFEIVASTGEVTFKDTPNYEIPADADLDNKYEVTVTASDGVPAHDQTKNVTISVTDTNDLSPMFTFWDDGVGRRKHVRIDGCLRCQRDGWGRHTCQQHNRLFAFGR